MSWVVRFEGHGHIAVAGQEGDITTWGVVVLEGAIGNVIRVEGTVLLGDEYEVVAVEMHGVGDGDEDASAGGDLLLGALSSHDEVDPVLRVVVLGDESVLWVVEGVVVQMVDQGVGEVEPHGGIEDIPASEVAVSDTEVGRGPFHTHFKVVTGVGIDCEGSAGSAK